jgi:DNA-directed RNA polymerase specialized sigma24 family protein
MDEVREFEAFVVEVEPRLRRALIAAYGSERGREATAEALGWAWEHRDRLKRIENKVAFLFRVGQSKSRGRKQPIIVAEPEHNESWVEPGLRPALTSLTERQRTAVVLVYGFGWTLREVADLTGVRVSTVQSYLERGLTKLRNAMKVVSDVGT